MNSFNYFFIYNIIGMIGYLIAVALFIKMRTSIANEKARSLSFLNILSAAQQEWFCLNLKSNDGVASSGLHTYLNYDRPLTHLDDFSQAFLQKFSFEITPILKEVFAKDTLLSKTHKISIKCPKTHQSCDLFIATQAPISLSSMTNGQPNGQKNIIFWVRDTSDFYEQEDKYAKKYIELDQQNKELIKILDMIPQPLWTRTLAGQLTYCNQFYADALEASRDTLIQDNKLLWQENSPENSISASLEKSLLYRPLKRSIVLKEERRFYQFKEEQISESDVVLGQGCDLTDLENAVLALKQHTMAYQEVMDNLSAGVSIYGADKKLKFFNHAYALLFEMDENWLNTHPSLSEILDDVRDRRLLAEQADYLGFKKQQLQMVSSLLSPYQQLEHLPDGRTIRRITAPHPLGGVFFIFENVTNSLELERQYNTQLAVHRASLDHLYEGVAVYGCDNRLKIFNPAFAKIWGMPEGEFKIDQHITDSIDLIQNIVHYEGNWIAYRSYIISNVTDRISKKTQMSCQGEKVINITYVPLPDGSHLLSCIDVSDTHRIERVLRERNEALETADRLKSDFVAHVSHKLRMPLNSITGFSQMLIDQYFGQLNSQQLLYCQAISDHGHQLLNMVNNTLNLAVLEGGYLTLNPQKMNMFKFLSDIKKLFDPEACKKEINFILDCHQDIGFIWADEYYIQQILNNILKNALHFTPSSGSVTIKAERLSEEMMVQISDTGIGIAQQDLARVFEKFQSASNNNFGDKELGLGLTLVKNLMDQQKGRIHIDSTVDRGTIVTCFFQINMTLDQHQAA